MPTVTGAVYREFNFDDPQSVHHLETIELPSEPSAGQCLVRMVMAPIQPCDLQCAQGLVNGVQFPAYGGCEGVGVIEAVGPDLGDRFAAGQRVHVTSCHIFGNWTRWEGTWRSHIMCPAEALVPVPDGISDEEACQLEVNPVTVVAMAETMKLGPGNVMLQTAAASVVGKLMVQLGDAYGFDTVNLVRRESAVEELKREVGAKYVYVYDGTPESGDRVRAAIRADLGDKAIDHCIEAVGGDTFRYCLDLLGPNGRIYIYGCLSNEVDLTFHGVADVVMKNNSIHGWSTQEVWMRQTSDAGKQAVIDKVWSLMLTGKLKLPKPGGIFPLSDLHAAVAASVEPNKPGKVLLRLDA